MIELYVPASLIHSYSTNFRKNGSFSFPKSNRFGKKSISGVHLIEGTADSINAIHGYQTFKNVIDIAFWISLRYLFNSMYRFLSDFV